MKYTPVIAGAAVGIIDSEISYTSLSKHKYAHGIFKFGALALGLTAELMDWFTPNVNYGMMTGSSYLIGARIPAIFHDKTLKSIATYAAPSVSREAPTAAGMAKPEIHTHATVQGSVAPGCSACGSHAAPAVIPGRRTDIPSRSPITSAGYSGEGTDYHAVNSKPSEAG